MLIQDISKTRGQGGHNAHTPPTKTTKSKPQQKHLKNYKPKKIVQEWAHNAPLCQWYTKEKFARTFHWMWTWKKYRSQASCCHLCYHARACQTGSVNISANTGGRRSEEWRETESWWHNLSLESSHTYSRIQNAQRQDTTYRKQTFEPGVWEERGKTVCH